MRCINKITAGILTVCLVSGTLSGCTGKQEPLKNPYPVYQNSLQNTDTEADSDPFFAASLCTGGYENVGMDTTDSQVAEGAGVFNTATHVIPYAQNIYEKLYPASTTKILTAYIALKYGNPDDVVTISSNALDIDPNSSTCGLQVGDQITLRDLLYGMMMKSGNDAAIAIAEHISGDVATFADKMNEEAAKLGATTSHFVNPNGLPDENHYTSVYDLYLLFQAAIGNEDFCNIIKTTTYTANYTSASGEAKTQEWTTTNQYFTGDEKTPDGFTVLGGKTGTTGDAGYCLVLLSQNAAGQEIISIVLKADCKINLYLLMNQILSGYGN